LSKWSRVKNSKAKFVADETCLLLVRVVSVKEVFLLLPSTLRHKCNGMYFLFNTFILKKYLNLKIYNEFKELPKKIGPLMCKLIPFRCTPLSNEKKKISKSLLNI
jgi:hypothetical protein